MKLGDLSVLVRAKNAGPFTLTIDIIFKSSADLERVVNSGKLDKDAVSILYGLRAQDITYFELPKINSIKFSFPRSIPSGGLGDNDVFGCQAHAQIVSIEIP